MHEISISSAPPSLATINKTESSSILTVLPTLQSWYYLSDKMDEGYDRYHHYIPRFVLRNFAHPDLQPQQKPSAEKDASSVTEARMGKTPLDSEHQLDKLNAMKKDPRSLKPYVKSKHM